MELLTNYHSLVRFLADQNILSGTPFRLLDIGCSGGIAEAFRLFGMHSLKAVGIDPNLNEISRLQAVEEISSIKYIPSYCGLPIDHPFVKNRKGNWWGNNLSHRLSTTRAIDIRGKQEKTPEELTIENAWNCVHLAAEEDVVGVDEITLREFNGVIDFLKIDVDGADLAVLHSASNTLRSPELLGIHLEVNYHGTADPTDNTFHNMDRMMRQYGFELFDLTTRRYSSTALPSPFLLSYPAQTRAGRIFQGDAIYFRDLAAANAEEVVLRPESLLKLACLFNIFGLLDCCAELLLSHQKTIEQIINVNQMLDIIVQEATGSKISYHDYIANWETRVTKEGEITHPIRSATSEILTLVNTAQQQNRPLVIWGYGDIGKLIYPHLAPLVRYIVDSNPLLIGTPVGQHLITSHESLTSEILENHSVIFTPQERQLPGLLADMPQCHVLRATNHQFFGFS